MTVPLGDLLCPLTPATGRRARTPPLMKRPMIVLGAPPTRERQPRAAEVHPAVVARAPAHAACFVAHSSDDVGTCKRLKNQSQYRKHKLICGIQGAKHPAGRAVLAGGVV